MGAKEQITKEEMRIAENLRKDTDRRKSNNQHYELLNYARPDRRSGLDRRSGEDKRID